VQFVHESNACVLVARFLIFSLQSRASTTRSCLVDCKLPTPLPIRPELLLLLPSASSYNASKSFPFTLRILFFIPRNAKQLRNEIAAIATAVAVAVVLILMMTWSTRG
jgi:hypothetical protein